MPAARRLALVALTALFTWAAPHAVGADPVDVALTGYVHKFNPGIAIGAETDPAGWVLSTSPINYQVTLPRIAYLDGADAGIRLAPFAERYVTVHGSLLAGALAAGGVETPYRTFDLLKVAKVEIDDTMPTIAPHTTPRLTRRLLADLAARGVDFGRDGTATPQGGLAPDGTVGGHATRLVALAIPPVGSADMYTDVAYLDRASNRYWALRTGGFIAVTQWVGPFKVPAPRGR